MQAAYTMQPPRITAKEFSIRLIVMCLSGTGTGFPKKQRDRFILLNSAVQSLEEGRPFSELEINEALKKWLRDVGRRLEIDHVTLGRSLVDDGYLARDANGTTYRVCREGRGQVEFEAGVEALDMVALLDSAELEIAARRAREFIRH